MPSTNAAADATADKGSGMHRARLPWRGVRRLVLACLVLLDLALLAFAIRLGGDIVRDGAGSVTSGYNVAFSLAATLAAAFALRWLRVPGGLRAAMQTFALFAQAAHALGHLARWYYTLRWYDDTLHIVLLFGAALLALRLAQAWDLFPARHATRVRAALLAIVLALALASVWEIFEFTMDTLQRTREQDDLTDTMLDMIDGALGGALAAAWAAWRPSEAQR